MLIKNDLILFLFSDGGKVSYGPPPQKEIDARM